jgi:prepilin peptidase CpaA
MENWTLAQYVFTVGIVLVTSAAVYTDLRFAKIPNKLTLPFFALGWIYQAWANGPQGLLDGLQGFALGFGTYFVLWIVSGGGGGDTKLMGALSVWLGFRLTLYVIVVSTLLVAIDLIFVTISRFVRFGFRGVKERYSSAKDADDDRKPHSAKGRGASDNRRRLRFAVPLAMAAWLVLLADATILKGGQLAP